MRTRVQPQDSAPLSSALEGDKEQQTMEVKRIILTMLSSTDIKVSFEGFWDGRLLRNATNMIEKSYRTIRHQKLREVTSTTVKENAIAEEKGDKNG